MTITVLYFAVLRDLTGIAEERVDVPPGLGSLGALGAHLEDRHPGLRGRLGPVRFALNEAFAEPGASLAEGDVVALLPPVSGG